MHCVAQMALLRMLALHALSGLHDQKIAARRRPERSLMWALPGA